MKSLPLKFTFLTLALSLFPILHAHEIPSVKYGPHITTLIGTILEQPYGEDAAPSDQGKSAWILKLKNPISVEAQAGDEIDVAEKNVTEIHLNIDHSKFPIQKSELGKTVFQATGTLYHAHTTHHLRPIVMLVSTLKAEQGAAANP